ncbi:MAG: hypothetical protein M3R21_07140, partial [Candidatus Dormibacteraeota bacterium]|nr:hypothetical protein [Candidatus Dormibacteraeota bacterium]
YSLAATSMLLAFYATIDQTALPANLPPAVLSFLQAGYATKAVLVIGAGALLLAMTLFYNRDAKNQLMPAVPANAGLPN